MYDILKEQLEGFQDLVLKETPNYHAMITLRRVLIELDEDRRVAFDNASPAFSESVHAGMAARCKFDLTTLGNLEQVEGLITPFAEIVFKLMIAMRQDDFSSEDIYAMAERELSLKI